MPQPAPPTVASVGSANLDRTYRVDADAVDALAARHDWFPAPGETVTVQSPPTLERDPDEVALGGKGANQAVAAAAAGADAALYGCVGDDAGEYGLRERLRDRDVAVDGVATVERPTGTAHVWVTPDGENRIAVVPGANGAVDESHVAGVVDDVAVADAVCLQNEIPAAAGRALLDGLADVADAPTVVLDPAPAAGAEPLVAHPAVDVCTPNEAEADALAGVLSDTDATVVVTRGDRGVAVFEAGRTPGAEPTDALPSLPVTPTDTTGAGDAFAGHLAAGLARGAELREALADAVVAGALATTVSGAQVAPTRARVEAVRGHRET